MTADEKMASPDMPTRVAGRLDRVEANFTRIGYRRLLAARTREDARALPWWAWRARRGLAAEARRDLEIARRLLEENDMLMQANAADIWGARHGG